MFEGDEWNNLIQECKSGMQGVRAVDDAEYFARFTKQVRRLHTVLCSKVLQIARRMFFF